MEVDFSHPSSPGFTWQCPGDHCPCTRLHCHAYQVTSIYKSKKAAPAPAIVSIPQPVARGKEEEESLNLSFSLLFFN